MQLLTQVILLSDVNIEIVIEVVKRPIWIFLIDSKVNVKWRPNFFAFSILLTAIF